MTRPKDVLIVAGNGTKIIENSLYDILVSELSKKYDIIKQDIEKNGIEINDCIK